MNNPNCTNQVFRKIMSLEQLQREIGLERILVALTKSNVPEREMFYGFFSYNGKELLDRHQLRAIRVDLDSPGFSSYFTTAKISTFPLLIGYERGKEKGRLEPPFNRSDLELQLQHWYGI